MRSLAGLVRVLAVFAMVAPVVEAAGARVRGRAATTFEVGKATTAATTEASGTGTTHQQLDPEFQRELDKLDATQAKVRSAMSVQRDALAVKKEALKVIQEQEKEAQSKVDEVTAWLERAQDSINKMDSQKQAVRVRFDLKRLRPLVGIAAEKKKKLIMETEKIGSAHKEVSSRVAALEAELEELEAEKAGKGSNIKAVSSESGSSSGSLRATPASNNASTTLAPSLDAMLADLTG